MSKVYKIADEFIRFNCPIKIEDSLYSLKFLYDDCDDEDGENYIDYNIIFEKDESDREYDLLRKGNFKKIELNENKTVEYDDENIWWHCYRNYNNSKTEYCSLYENNRNEERHMYFYKFYDGYKITMEDVIRNSDIQSLLLHKNCLILHSTFIIYNGQAILFSGFAGAGKSTQGNLWKKNRNAEVINGDRTAVKFRDSQLYAFGLPFCGSSDICVNKEAPIKAIVFVNKHHCNSIEPMEMKEAFTSLLSQIAVNRWNSADYSKVIDLIYQFINSVTILRLNCRPDEESTLVLKDYLGI